MDRASTNKSRGGGILCAVQDSILSLDRADLEPDDEILVTELRPNKNHKMAVILGYRAPDGDIGTFIDSVRSALTRTYAIDEHIAVVGDFNLPNVKGCHESEVHSISDSEQLFCDITNDFFSDPGK